MKNKLKHMIEARDSSSSKLFDTIMMIIIFLSMITFSVGTIPSIDSEFKKYMHILDNIFIALFTLEYFTRLYVADKKLSYVFSIYGIIDLIAILPFFLGLFFDGQFAKSLRFLRVFRLIKLTRYSKTMQKFATAFYNAREEFAIFAFITVIMFFIASVGIYQFEHEAQPKTFGSVFESMWWAVATLTTVGYGDVYPITVGGKIFTGLTLIIGLGIVGVPAGIIAAAFTELGINDDKNDTIQKRK